jgi:hypothetical protein
VHDGHPHPLTLFRSFDLSVLFALPYDKLSQNFGSALRQLHMHCIFHHSLYPCVLFLPPLLPLRNVCEAGWFLAYIHPRAHNVHLHCKQVHVSF